jgi:hypothetical protein
MGNCIVRLVFTGIELLLSIQSHTHTRIPWLLPSSKIRADEVGEQVIYTVGEDQRWTDCGILALPVNDVTA